MGKKDLINTKPFTIADVKNKQLVIQMLNYEEQLTKSDYGQSLYKNTLNKPFVSLNIEKSLNRLTLTQFGFDTSDTSVETYRTIFRTYYNSPHDYDKDVLNAVHYMRENKCVYYKTPQLQLNNKIPNCELYNLNKNKTTLYDIINKSNSHTMLCAFSLS
jgi:hypothetical protein